MPRNSGDRHDEAGQSNSPNSERSEKPELDATVGDTHVSPDLGETVDSVRESAEAAANPNVEASDQDNGLGATFVPGDGVSDGGVSVTVVSDWEATLDADVEPGHTIKAPAAVTQKRRGSIKETVALKRREVRQSANDQTADASNVADADYQIEELLGEGGMGAVYAARQKSMDRPVAIKVLKSRAARLASSQDAFVSEAVITGRLDHPNIVPIYDVGKQPNDALFYAMKQVEGVEWKKRFATNTVSENLDVLLRVSDAIAFAHARGIIHRDLKPANIMLGPFGEVLVMDWGLAMPTEDNPSREAFPIVRAGGTPHYMAPEMADGTESVDRRSDVYLLGAMLFEIMTGKPPHAIEIPKGTRRERVLAVLDAVADNVTVETDESGELLNIARKAIATVPADRYQTVPEFQAALREYLSHEESIELAARASERLAAGKLSGEYIEFSRARFGFETALEEWPDNERATEGLRETRFDYAKTAFDRGDLDLASSLIDEHDSKQKELGTSILKAIADRDARQQQLRRLRRISLAASLSVAIVAVVAAVWINSERDKALAERGKALIAQQDEAAQRLIAQRNEKDAQEQRKIAVSEREKAVASEKVALENEKKATTAEAIAVREADNALRSLKIAERNAYYSNMLLANTKWDNSSTRELENLLNRYVDRDELCGFEWGYWNRMKDSASLTLHGHEAPVTDVVYGPDGSRLATSCYDGSIKLWDASTGQQIRTLKAHFDVVTSVAFSPDGKLLASASNDRTVAVWSLAAGQKLHSLNAHKARVIDVSFSPDGNSLASVGNDRVVRIWDVESGREKLTLTGHSRPVSGVSFSADGTLVASGGTDRTVRVWDAVSGKELLTLKGHANLVYAVSFSPDMTRLASAGNDGTVRVWDVATGDPVHTLAANSQPVLDVSFSPDGKWLASSGSDNSVRVWNSVTGRETLAFKGHRHEVTSVSFSPDGTRLASASLDHKVKIWYLIPDQDAVVLSKGSKIVRSVSFSPDGTRLASADADRMVRLWDVASGQQLHTLEGHSTYVTSVSFSPDGTRLAAASGEVFRRANSRPGDLKVWDVASGQELLTLAVDASAILSVVFSADGALLATGSMDGRISLWNADNGQKVRTLEGHSSQVTCVMFGPDSEELASASEDGTMKLWTVATGLELMKFTTERNPVNSLSFSPDGKRLASAHHFGGIRVRELAKAEGAITVIPALNRINSVSFSPDGRQLVSGGHNGVVNVWDATTGQQTLTLPGQDSSKINSVSFSPDGLRLVAANDRGTLKLWDARPWTPEHRVQAQARSYLKLILDRKPSLEELEMYIRDDKTISEEVRQQCLGWAELFWQNR